jgi:hypothetical protein
MKNPVDEFNDTRDAPENRGSLAVALRVAVLVLPFCLLRGRRGREAGLWSYLLLACPLTHPLHGHGRHAHTASHGIHGTDRGAGGG